MLKENIWIEKLGPPQLLFFIIKGFFNSNLKIRYNKYALSPAGNFVLYCLRRAGLGKNFYAFDFSLAKRDDEGSTLLYRIDSDLNICAEEFCRRNIAHEPQGFQDMVKCYLFSVLRGRVAFASAIISEIDSRSELKREKHTIYFSGHPLNKIILSFYSKKNFKVKETLGFIENIKYFILPIYYVLRLLLFKIKRQKTKSNIVGIRPSIWIEYDANSIVDFAFWFDGSPDNNFDTVFYLDRKDTPSSPKIINKIEARGLKWIDARFPLLAKTCRFNLRSLGELLRGAYSLKSHYPHWYRVLKFQYKFWFFLYKSLFEHFNVKIIIQHQDAFWRQEVQARAIEAAGGIMLGMHWSSYHCVMAPSHLFPEHVFFTWGKFIDDLLREGANTCRYILPCGLWLGPDEHPPAELAGLSDNLDFIIAVFDSGVGYNLHQTPESLSEFYLKMLGLLENNLSWGGVIKSKTWDLARLTCLPNGAEIVRRLKQLIIRKKAVILKRSVSPTTAASCADLCVCYGLNSAGIIAGTYGYKAIHWDCVGWKAHAFFNDQGQQFVYINLEAFEEAILKASKGDKTIGDFSAWRREFNYFDDFKAAQRVAEFIGCFMGEVIKTREPRHSLNFSAKRYLETNKIREAFLTADNSSFCGNNVLSSQKIQE